MEDLSIFYSLFNDFKGPRYRSLGFFRGPREKGFQKDSEDAKGGRLGGIGCYE